MGSGMRTEHLRGWGERQGLLYWSAGPCVQSSELLVVGEGVRTGEPKHRDSPPCSPSARAGPGMGLMAHFPASPPGNLPRPHICRAGRRLRPGEAGGGHGGGR